MRLGRRNLTIWLTAAVVLTAVSGCARSYNGALGFLGGNEPAPHEGAAQATAPHSAAPASAVTTATAPEAGASHVVFSDPVMGLDAIANPPIEAEPGMAGGVNNLALFGQVDDPSLVRVSAMDGPGNLTRMTFTPEGSDFTPAIDPTGTHMVFASTRHRNRPDLYIKRIDGSTITQLTNDPSDDVMPAFSPDGKRIAFASRRSGSWDIYVMDLDGRNQAVQITSDPTHDIHPSFSPDGTQLVYSSYGSSSGQWEMIVVSLENPSRKQFIGHGLFPQWSPVENKILYQRARQRGTRWFSLWTIDLVEGESRSPTEIAASTNAALITPAWSPDGKQIVFCTVDNPAADNQSRPGRAEVWIVNRNGTGRTRLIGGPFANLQPTWGADGTIYFVSDRAAEGTENIWAIRPEAPNAAATTTATASPAE